MADRQSIIRRIETRRFKLIIQAVAALMHISVASRTVPILLPTHGIIYRSIIQRAVRIIHPGETLYLQPY